ncbi:MAG: hypothetical protein B6U89_05210 [Desulfurococcales archaeon ex4484_58]|nr:MAG: hypothetical protein B6U89_05210 [Desulfurococcales archaeon ex4484_58]
MYRVDFLRKKLNGWDEERIQDDLEIGCRIMSLNKKILFLDKDPVYVEIPRRYRSLRLQQDRWVYGATDVAITRFTHLMRSKQPWYAKFDALYYLLQYLPAISTFIGFLILSFIVLLEPQDYIREYWFLGLPWMILAFIYGKYYVDSLREYGYSVWRTIVNLGRSAALTVSLTPTLTKSFFQALLRLKVGFKRTPKGRYEHLLSNIRVPIETIVGLYALFIGINLLINQILYTGGWFLSYSLGYIYATIRWWKDIIYR